MHRVAVLALAGVIPFELSIPSRLFACAAGAAGEALYEVLVCTADGGPVRTEAGFSIAVDHSAAVVVPTADTLVVAPVHLGDGGYPPTVSDAVIAFLAQVRPGTRIVSICTASFFLAAAGLLDGRRATTHWHRADLLRRMYPRVTVDPDVLFVDDGDVLTSAGAASGIDLCLHLIRRDHGSDVANRVARDCIVPPWRDGGQAQYIERPVPPVSVASTAPTRDWALTRLREPTTLTAMAAHARMSVRTFTRRFRDEVGLTPGQWLIGQRVDRARHLLESTDLPMDAVAREAGFGTDISLRQHFHAALGVAPTGYRRTFHAGPDERAGVPMGGGPRGSGG